MIYDTHGKHPRAGCMGHFGDLELVVDAAVEALGSYVDRFDSIVVTGVSGCVVGSPLSLALKKPRVVVRKPEDDSHSAWRGREGVVLGLHDLGTRACFVDDLISSGATRRRVQEAIAPEATVVLQYTYDPGHEGFTYPPSQQYVVDEYTLLYGTSSPPQFSNEPAFGPASPF